MPPFHRIQVIDSHTGGEPTRVVVGGGPDLGRGSLAERRARLRSHHDGFRSAVVNEPRGSDVVVGALLCEPVDPTCAAGVIFFNNVSTIGMCGHGTIGLAVTLAHMERIRPGRHRLETPVGVVTFEYAGGNGVSVENVPSHRHSRGVKVAVEGFGTVTGDVAWGGNWFFLVDDHGLKLELAAVDHLRDLSWRIRQALTRHGVTGANGEEIDHIELLGPAHQASAQGRNFVLCPGRAYDRSPCGTGTSAKLACLHADGKLKEGQVWRQEGIVGTVFEGTVRIEEGKVIPIIRGSAYITAEATLLLDKEDPFREGIRGMTSGAGHVVVVGSGVVGTACAYYLARAGWRVTVLERGAYGMGCSHANCGFVCPSHVLPLAMPGAIGSAIKAILTPNSPLTIRPRFDLELWSWLLRFALRCNARDMLQASQDIRALLQSSRALYPEILAQEKIDCEWEARGMLFVCHSHQGMEHYAATDRLLSDHFGLAARRFDGDAVTDLEPALKPGLGGGWLYDSDAHLRPDRLMSGWQKVLERLGVEIRTGCALTGFVRDKKRATAVRTTTGTVAADAFVVATGAMTPLLNRVLGCRIPIQPGKGYSLTMPRPARCPTIPLIFEEHRVAVTPMRSGYRLGSTMEFAGYDSSLNRRRLNLLREGARLYLHEPETTPVQEEWYGWRPMTPDSVPIIDRSPTLANVMIAAGHNMLGLSMAPATGKLVAEMLGGEKPHLDPVPYALGRF